MPEKISVVINDKEVREVEVGTTVGEVLQATPQADIVGALINQTLTELDARITVPINLTPVTRHDRPGREILNRTSWHMIEYLLAKHFPELHFQIGQSIGQGFYYELLEWTGEQPDLEKVCQKLDELVTATIKADMKLTHAFVNVDNACVSLTDHRGSMSKLLEIWPYNMVPLVSIGDDKNGDRFTAIKYGPMAPSTGYCGGLKITHFPKGFLLQFSRDAITPDPDKTTRLLHAYRESRSWNRMIGVATLGDLNEIVLKDNIKDVIMTQEGLHEQKIVEIAAEIAKRRDKVRLVCIAGPSSSGKTTFVRRLSVQLKVLGINPVVIGMDDYYRDRVDTPLDANGKIDFEAFDALDVPLLTQHLEMIVRGEPIMVPRFDFPSGRRAPASECTRLQLKPNEMLLIEGIHGLNPTITNSVPEEARFRIFVSALTQLVIDEHNRIPTSDGRLLRRIVRDRRYRGTSAAGTIAMWPSVRAGEERNIFPFQNECDAMFNSTLIYEVAVFKTFAWRYLLEVDRNDPAWSQASSLLRFLDLFVPVFPDYVPSNSVLREFIGGSHFSY